MIVVDRQPFRGATLAPPASPRPVKALKVLHLSASDNSGGSARSAYRIHDGLRRLGVESRMLVGWRVTDDPAVDLVAAGRLWIADRIANRLTERLSLQYLWHPSSMVLPHRRWVREADIIQLYNVHGGYMSHTVLPALCRRHPVVWRLSDLWPMTGHCAYDFGCGRWKTGCGSCPIVSDYPGLRHDRTAWLWRVKERLYRRCTMTIVAPSRWIARFAQDSPLLGRFPVRVIPNGLDTDVFRPMPREAARHALGLPAGKRFILFGAHYASERRKGAILLGEALARLAQSGISDVALLVMGRESDRAAASLAQWPVRTLGAIQDDRMLAMAYAAADMFVLPTLADNLPNTVLESMACGTAVVAFAVGGVPEAVRHLETGYAARAGDPADLAEGIRHLLDNAPLREQLGRRGREVVEAEYTLQLQAERFLALYEDLREQRREARTR